jgi:hypothetical protein
MNWRCGVITSRTEWWRSIVGRSAAAAFVCVPGMSAPSVDSLPIELSTACTGGPPWLTVLCASARELVGPGMSSGETQTGGRYDGTSYPPAATSGMWTFSRSSADGSGSAPSCSIGAAKGPFSGATVSTPSC